MICCYKSSDCLKLCRIVLYFNVLPSLNDFVLYSFVLTLLVYYAILKYIVLSYMMSHGMTWYVVMLHFDGSYYNV